MTPTRNSVRIPIEGEHALDVTVDVETEMLTIDQSGESVVLPLLQAAEALKQIGEWLSWLQGQPT